MNSVSLTCAAIAATFALTSPGDATSTPWKGTPRAIPGKIEAEHYDEGAADIAYHDVEAKNLGEPYRKDTHVDIEKRPDASNGHGVGWTRKGEWIKYTVNVARDGTYRVRMPVASNKKGGLFHMEIAGKDISGPIQVPDTGGWDTLKTIEHSGIQLQEGVQTIKIVMDEQGPSGSIGDIDCFIFKQIK